MALFQKICLPRKSFNFSTVPLLEPSYIIHPRVRTKNPEIQPFALTKTQTLEQPPCNFQEHSKTLDVNPWKRLIEKSIIFARNFETQSEDVSPDFPFILLQNIFKNIFSQTPQYSQLRNMFIANDFNVKSTWECMGNRIDVRGRPGSLIKSKTQFSRFYGKNIVKKSEKFDIPLLENDSIFSNLNTWNVHENIPLKVPLNQKFPYSHTLLLIDNQNIPEPYLLQKCVLYLHGILLQQAIFKHGNGIIGTELLEPECGQAIITNGKEFSFIWYQLNTLDLQTISTGVKNLLAVEKPSQLYTDVHHINARLGHTGQRLTDFKEEVLRNFISMFLWQ